MKNEDFLIKLSKIIISFNENNNDLKNNQLFLGIFLPKLEGNLEKKTMIFSLVFFK